MPQELIASLIAFIGVVISVIVSLFSTNQKIKKEIQQHFTSKILNKRLEYYPEFYSILSGFMKKIELDNYDQKDISDLIEKINKWDSQNALFFSGKTNIQVYDLRAELRRKLSLSEQKFEEEKQLDKEKNKEREKKTKRPKLKHYIGGAELALKGDLGIFVSESGKIFKRYKSYQQQAKELRKKINRYFES